MKTTDRIMNTRNRTKYLVELALMIAIIFIMAFTPLGYLRTPGLSITFLTVPVAVGAIILGPKGGAICGTAFGVTSLMQAMMGGSPFAAMLFGISPIGTAVLCVVPRILEGFLCGLIFQMLKSKKNIAYLIASLSCPLLNTLFFMSALVLIFYRTDYIQGLVDGLGVSNPVNFVIAFVGIQGLIEAVVCTVISTAVSRTLAIALK